MCSTPERYILIHKGQDQEQVKVLADGNRKEIETRLKSHHLACQNHEHYFVLKVGHEFPVLGGGHPTFVMGI